MSNYEYMKTLDIELFHAVLGGLMGLSMNRYDADNIALMKWLQAEEVFTKGLNDKEIDNIIHNCLFGKE